MARVDERVAHLEGQVNELSQRLGGVEAAIQHLEQRADVRFDNVDRRFEAIDRRFEAVDRRFDTLDRRIDALDTKWSHQLDALDTKISRQFVWLVGIMVTTMIAMVGAVLSRG
jgi:tetrahydromethanopterin S-methyltransferase subunit G